MLLKIAWPTVSEKLLYPIASSQHRIINISRDWGLFNVYIYNLLIYTWLYLQNILNNKFSNELHSFLKIWQFFALFSKISKSNCLIFWKAVWNILKYTQLKLEELTQSFFITKIFVRENLRWTIELNQVPHLRPIKKIHFFLIFWKPGILLTYLRKKFITLFMLFYGSRC